MAKVLSLCDRSGVMVQPWLDAGHECWVVDIQHEAGQHREGNLVRVGADITRWMPPLCKWGIVFCFPPCTDLAVSGARWFRDKGLRRLIDALELVESCRAICEASGAPYMLENPVGALSTYWRKPDCAFDPYQFGGYLPFGGDAYTKRTHLWIGKGFQMPVPRRVEATEGSKMHLLPPGPDRADQRSETPAGFAAAVFEANEKAVRLSSIEEN